MRDLVSQEAVAIELDLTVVTEGHCQSHAAIFHFFNIIPKVRFLKYEIYKELNIGSRLLKISFKSSKTNM